ncbi:MAG: hypothetical protein CH6_0265 [Candidatus Kapaibacterium sp.]|jgi:hypothetical protein|nr:MAG: hypothetical protein CH6_0265 [Candidatus Kapabacteria bacterium]ROL56287.1 MAG: hypothetical protein D9V84_08950 [Bacteroidetes/Chlorobi group bacterium Naka2016]
MKKLVAFGFLVLLSPLFLYSQFLNNTSVQLILKGKVYDEYTGNPVGAIIEFRTTTGKKFKIKSDSVSGEYSQVFNSGDKIEVIIYDWDVVREKFSVQLPDTNKYAEIEQNFKVKHLKEGLVAYRFNCFETGSAEILPDCKANLLSLDEVLRFNRNVKFEIQVTAFDTYYKTKRKQKIQKVVTEKKKKKTITEEVETIEEPPADKIKDLVDKRLPSIEQIVGEIPRGKGRLTVKPIYQSGNLPNGEFPEPYEIFVVVKELKNILEK